MLHDYSNFVSNVDLKMASSRQKMTFECSKCYFILLNVMIFINNFGHSDVLHD